MVETYINPINEKDGITTIETAIRKRRCHSCGFDILKGTKHLLVKRYDRRINICSVCLSYFNRVIKLK